MFFFYPNFLKVVCPSHLLSHSQGVSTLSVLCVPSLSVLCNRSYFHPCLSVTVAAGWLNIYIFHSLVTFPCCRSGSSSLLAALLLTDYCLQISYGHSKWYTGSQGQRVQRLEKGRKREREREGQNERARETVVSRADCQSSDWKLKRQSCWRSICMCRDMDWSGVIFYLWCHLDCGFLSAQMVCNKLPEKRCKSWAPGILSVFVRQQAASSFSFFFLNEWIC